MKNIYFFGVGGGREGEKLFRNFDGMRGNLCATRLGTCERKHAKSSNFPLSSLITCWWSPRVGWGRPG